MQKIGSAVFINWIIFFFQFESFGLGPITVVRFLIAPLLLLYLCRESVIDMPKSFLLLFCLLFCCFETVSGIFNGELGFIISGFVNFLTVVVFVDHLMKKNGLTSANVLMFASYDLPCILYFLVTFSGINLRNRFQGIYWDPNVMCIYILIAFCAKIILLYSGKRTLLEKMILGILFCMDVFLVFSSLSRAGILAFGLVLLLVTFMYSKWLFSLLVSLLCVLLGHMWYIAQSLTWSLDLTPMEALTYRIFVSSAVEIEKAGVNSRSARFESFLEALKHGDISIIGNGTNFLPNGDYIHNGIFEFVLAVGVPLGVIFILSFLYLLCKNIFWPFLKNKGQTVQIFVFSYFVVTVFYSYLSFKSFWVFMACLLFLNSRKVKVPIR